MSATVLRINNLDFRGSTSDRPSVSNAVFFQGCDSHCPCCHNLGTWDSAGGQPIEVRELVALIDRETSVRRITISGGEPLLQEVSLGQPNGQRGGMMSSMQRIMDNNSYIKYKNNSAIFPTNPNFNHENRKSPAVFTSWHDAC